MAETIHLNDTQLKIAAVIADWLALEVQVLERSGLTREEAARYHNRLLKRHRVLDLLNTLMNEAGNE